MSWRPGMAQTTSRWMWCAHACAKLGVCWQLGEQTCMHVHIEQQKRSIVPQLSGTATVQVSTSDGQLICRHDLTLDNSTNVGELPQFAGRRC